jgi:hypothetical protein
LTVTDPTEPVVDPDRRAVLALLAALYALVVAPDSLSEEGSGNVLRITLLVVRWPLLAVGAMVGLRRRLSVRAEWRRAALELGLAGCGARHVGLVGRLGRLLDLHRELRPVQRDLRRSWRRSGRDALAVHRRLRDRRRCRATRRLERQTAQDTTTGRPEAMGRRDAYAADTLGESPGR